MGDLALLAGIVGSDGHLAKDEPQVIVINKDKEFINDVIVPLIKKVSGKNPTIRFGKSGFRTYKYLIRVWSPTIWTKMKDKFGIPAGAKSKIIGPPDLDSAKDEIDFLRGWIAGDGSVTTDQGRAKIELWSKSLNILSWFKHLLERKGIESRLFYDRKKREHILRIGKRNAIKLFYSTISIPHPKKQRKLHFLLAH
jgi:DNA-binding transcriptional regulator WhiA